MTTTDSHGAKTTRTARAKPGPLFAERLAAVPMQPGIYIMRGGKEQVLYVGKSASLRNRLRSYFSNPAALTGKTADLVRVIADFEFIVTESEQEALLLENSLIKKHQPRFNVRLKDDKTYPYIKVDLSEDFPRIYITRRTANDGARYFGPFASAGSVRKTLDLLNRLFPYRTCTKAITGTDERPCLEFHIKRCNAPCTGYASKAEYRDVIDQVLMFLDGNTGEVVREIKSAMSGASESLEFERAAALRDRLRAIERVYEGQKVVGMGRENLDAIALATAHDEAWVEIFFVRQGNLIGRDHFIMQGTRDSSVAEVVGQFVQQFYDSASYIPRTILVPERIEDEEVIESWLASRRDGPVSFANPQRGAKKRLVQMVSENAAQGLEQLKIKQLSNDGLMQQAMTELEEQLSLPRTPRRIECYDISHIQGTNVVASMSVFEDGKPKSSDYRRFKMKLTQNNDDFASMKEVLERRFKRLASANEARAKGDEPDAKSFGETPDLVLIDGGKGQLSAALETLLQLGVVDVPLASLAKREEEIFLPDSPEPVVLPRNSQALFLVQRARDEAHRFAVTYHRNLRSKSSTQSALDLVPGVGPKRKRDLVRKFGSVKGIREADAEQLASTPGMTRKLADRIKEYLG
ncbi:MAG: excinuclease ABC subunit UvrC [Chloroflexi bacterium]|nr:excinuclease ABC subunit UvrC [Chloroflexota bacterium]